MHVRERHGVRSRFTNAHRSDKTYRRVFLAWETVEEHSIPR
jgi:hypothetical protein